MTNQILHINSEDTFIRKHRGKIVCEYKDERLTREMPIEDIRGLVVASKRTILTSNIISTLLENDSFILHCDSNYIPVGLTEPIERVIRKDALLKQANGSNSKLHKQIAKEIIKQKVDNQAKALEVMGEDNKYIVNQIENKKVNESSAARYYWQKFFVACGFLDITRNESGDSEVNKMLNYGYAILRSLCHRSIVVHGLSPVFGVQHKMRYHAHAFVYDVMEPLRPFVDLSLYYFLELCDVDDITDEDFKRWIKFSQGIWQFIKIKTDMGNYKLIDVIDTYVISIVDVFEKENIEKIWIPDLQNINIKKAPSLWVG